MDNSRLDEKKYPSLTVVIPVFNEEKTIEDVLKLVSYSNLVNEIVIVNDFSTDNSLGIMEKAIKLI